jgi:hypothetical protein
VEGTRWKIIHNRQWHSNIIRFYSIACCHLTDYNSLSFRLKHTLCLILCIFTIVICIAFTFGWISFEIKTATQRVSEMKFINNYDSFRLQNCTLDWLINDSRFVSFHLRLLQAVETMDTGRQSTSRSPFDFTHKFHKHSMELIKFYKYFAAKILLNSFNYFHHFTPYVLPAYYS